MIVYTQSVKKTIKKVTFYTLGIDKVILIYYSNFNKTFKRYGKEVRIMRISLAAARVNRKMTQQQLADALDVSKSSVQKWESGEVKPTLDNVEKICTVLDMSYDNIEWKG